MSNSGGMLRVRAPALVWGIGSTVIPLTYGLTSVRPNGSDLHLTRRVA
jgi:hypothetical protein